MKEYPIKSWTIEYFKRKKIKEWNLTNNGILEFAEYIVGRTFSGLREWIKFADENPEIYKHLHKILAKTENAKTNL